jgi:hypothetical protein
VRLLIVDLVSFAFSEPGAPREPVTMEVIFKTVFKNRATDSKKEHTTFNVAAVLMYVNGDDDEQ